LASYYPLIIIIQKAVVFINLWAINNDPEIWPEPTKFLPERHLNDAGEFVKSEKMLNFSLGNRYYLIYFK
jgi:cytochrome P450